MKPETHLPSPVPRSFWPHAIIGYFVLFIAGMVSFIAWAVRQNMDLVRPDYYEHEIRYQQHIDEVERTRRIESQVAIDYAPGEQVIVISLPPSHAPSATGTIHLYRPADESLDREIPLHVEMNGTQRVDVKDLRGGLWRVRLNWSAHGEDYFFDQAIVVANRP